MLTSHQLRELAVLAHVDPRTAQRWLNGERVMPAIANALDAAAAQLGVPCAAPATADAAAPHTRGARAISFVKPAKF